ncbi:MAG: hypothetical protein KatS3mg002_0330 [Candidatus Woesearchaeota archaeon]|nr:MAG: hypothetical protein KatS3mg002_0330 [Candidatus Woesearchaeota archaeon]
MSNKPVIIPNQMVIPNLPSAPSSTPGIPQLPQKPLTPQQQMGLAILSGLDPNQISKITITNGKQRYSTDNWGDVKPSTYTYDDPDSHYEIRIDKDYIYVPLIDGSMISIPNRPGRYIVGQTVIVVEKNNSETFIRTYYAD